MTDDDTARAAAAAIAGTLNKALADPHAREIVLTRDEALLTLGLVDGLAELLDREVRRK